MRFLKYEGMYVNADIIDCMHVTCCKTRESDDTVWGFDIEMRDTTYIPNLRFSNASWTKSDAETMLGTFLLSFSMPQENPVINLDWWVENYGC